MNGRGAGHHPGSGIHLLRAEAMAYFHAMILLDAIYMVEKDISREKNMHSLILEYEKILDALHPKLEPEGSARCAYRHCYHKQECYHDYRPKWNERLSLHNIVINQGKWLWNNNSLTPSQLLTGYLDTPAYYSCAALPCDELSFKASVSTEPYILAVGVLNNMTFYIDINVPETKLTGYKRPDSLKPWVNVRLGNMEAELVDVPVGNHVITIVVDGIIPKRMPTLSHVIVWI